MDSNLEIRQIKPEEWEAALQLVQDVFMKYEAPEYDEEGVRHFLTFIHDEEQTKQLEMYGAFTVNAAPYALKIYERLGFVATDTEKTEDGIRYTPMKYVGK